MKYPVFASMFVTICMSMGCGKYADQFKKESTKIKDQVNHQTNEVATDPPEAWRPATGVEYFADCADLQKYLDVLNWNRAHRGPIVAENTPTGANTANDGALNAQEVGVAEADQVQVSEDQIFFLRSRDLVVVDRKNHAEIGTLPFADRTSKAEFYVTSTHLLFLESTTDNIVQIKVMTLKTGQLPALETMFTVEGWLDESRLISNTLTLRTRSYLPTDIVEGEHIGSGLYWSPLPRAMGLSAESVACKNILKPTTALTSKDYDAELSSIYRIQLDAANLTIASIGLINASSTTYMNQHQLLFSRSTSDMTGNISELLQLPLDDSFKDLKVRSAGPMDGQIIDRWSIKASGVDDPIFIATSDRFNPDVATFTRWNHLYALHADKQNLVIDSRLDNIGQGEWIKAVRFAGSIAYIVTFRQTDPLYAIDISDPKNLKTLSTLKVPGFSSALYPLENHQLLGVGYTTTDDAIIAKRTGVQISLFDANDPSKVIRLDAKEYGTRQTVADAAADRHALFYDSGHKLIATPVVDYGRLYGQVSFVPEEQVGAIFYQIDGTKLTDVKRLTHSTVFPDAQAAMNSWQGCHSNDIRRVLTIDEQIATISDFGIAWHDPGSLDIKSTTAFTKGSSSNGRCSPAIMGD